MIDREESAVSYRRMMETLAGVQEEYDDLAQAWAEGSDSMVAFKALNMAKHLLLLMEEMVERRREFDRMLNDALERQERLIRIWDAQHPKSDPTGWRPSTGRDDDEEDQ